jgi:Zn-dependent protease with chaperone function
MSLVSGLFTLPVVTALQAYKQARFELPLKRSSIFGSERVYKADSRYAQVLSTLPGSHIKSAMQPFLDKAGIRKDLIFVEAPNIGFCSASGTDMFRNGDAAVVVAPGFYEADKDACSWVMKHEISHIKHNDPFTIHCVPCICQLAVSIFGMCSLSFLPALGLAFTVGIVSQALFSQWREAKADDFAIENSSDEELKGGRRLLMAMQETSIEERNTFWKRIAISASGDMRLDLLHPSITSRIQKIERALRTRNTDIDIEAERQKLEGGLKAYMTNKKREIEQAVEQAGGTFGIMKQMCSF